MKTELITKNIWKRLTLEAKKHSRKAMVAVAYFSKGASSMLPLRQGSILLVDASEKAVKAGQTCPEELLKLYDKGVKIYSKNWLHTKMFIFGNNLFVGSTNASHNSKHMTEAVIKTSEKKNVNEAKNFIKSSCKIELGREQLIGLQKKYKEPKFFNLIREKRKHSRKKKFVNESSFYVYHLELTNWKEDEEKQFEIGEKEAKKKRIKKLRHYVEAFLWEGKLVAKTGDIVMQILDEGKKTYVLPPGTIIHQRRWKHKGKEKAMTFVEVPNKRRKSLKIVESRLNRRERELLKRNGAKNSALAEKLNAMWN